MNNKLTLLVGLCILLILVSCNDYNDLNAENPEEESYIIPDSDMEKLIDNINRMQDEKIYSSFIKNEDDVNPNITDNKDDYQYGVSIAGYESYQDYNPMSVKDISKLSTGVWDVKFIGFSANSKYMLYELGSEFYIMDLYQKDKDNTIAYKTDDKQEAKAYSKGGFIETYHYDKNKDLFLKNDYFHFRVDRYQTETRKGFYVSIYDVNSKDDEYLIYSSTSGWAASLGDVNDYDVYFSPDNSWAVIQPYFDDYVYDYGFILINVRREYSKLLKKQAIDNYRNKKYQDALTKYRQSIQLYPATAEMFYDCAVLMKKLDMEDYPIFARKAVSLKPSKYSTKAVKDGLLPQ